MAETLLEVKDLTKYFPVFKGVIMRKQVGAVKAVDGVTFAIEQGNSFGLVGESGCGKTTIARCILLMEKITKGVVLFGGDAINKLTGPRLKEYKRSVQAVFQDPYSSLSPRMLVGTIISEPIIVHEKLSRSELRQKVGEILTNVGLSPSSAGYYPHEFSGGQRQRIAIARALSLNPKLIVLDEPVSALDVSIRAQILNLLLDLQQKFGLSYLLIAHDLAIVEHVSHTIGVMYLGKIVEVSPSRELYKNPLHPYTKGLIAAVPYPDPDRRLGENILGGEVPSPINPPPGCRFHPRCESAMPRCSQEEPILKEVAPNHFAACYLY